MQVAHIPEFEPYLGDPLPDQVQHVPSMMSGKERSLLIGLARYAYRGEGVIVDAGVFCGASTVCFGVGLRANDSFQHIKSRWRAPIRTFEYGIVNPGMISFFDRHHVLGDWVVGGDFSPLLKQNTASVSDLTRIRIGDIQTYKWKKDPIEVMFLDLLKTESVNRHVFKNLFRFLIPGALIIQQDYFIDGLPFVKISQERLERYFDYIGEVQSSAVFRLRETVPDSVLSEISLQPDDVEESLRLLDQARDRSIDGDRRLLCDLGKVRFLARTDNARASALLATLPETYPDQFSARQLPRLTMALRVASNAVKATACSAAEGA